MKFITGALLLTFCFIANAHSNPAIKQISGDVFTCDSSDKLLNAICQVGLHRINTELEASGISVDRNGVLFSFDNPEDKKINTGHSCTVTAQVKHQHASARISSAARLDLSGDTLTEPFAIRLQLPVSLSARVDVKQRFGFRFFGSCSNTGSDSYSFKGSLSTTADVVVGVSLNPSLGVVGSGDYGLVIEPKLAVLSRLRKTDIKFRASGVSPITPVVTFITGLSSTFLKSATAIFTGDSIKDILKSSLAFDLGAPIVLGVGALPRPLEDAIWNTLLNVGEHLIEKRAKGFGSDLEDKLQAKLRKSLKLDSEGKRVIIIKRDVVNLLRSAGIGADVFIEPPVDPSVACLERSKGPCRSSDISVIYRVCTPLRQTCSALRKAYEKKYKPSAVIPSKPKIASRAPARTPPPIRPQIKACLQRAQRLCSRCRGCRQCVLMLARCRNGS